MTKTTASTSLIDMAQFDRLTERENALYALATAGTEHRREALTECVRLGLHKATMPTERARVAYLLTIGGHDGIGRVGIAVDELADEARRLLPESHPAHPEYETA